MKQVLFLIIIVTLFSDLLALICSSSQQIICRELKIDQCKCHEKGDEPFYSFAIKFECNPPKHPVCLGNSIKVNCNCVS